MNIYSLYVTRSREERNYLNKVINLIKQEGFKNNIQIVHLDFKYTDVVHNIKIYRQTICAILYTFKNGMFSKKESTIYDFDDLIKLYKPLTGQNTFIYSGHSDGMYLVKHNIRILRIEDFCELIQKVIKKRADLMVFDCCLCGNIGCLSICKDHTKYVIASTGYWSYLSVLETKALYSNITDLLIFSKSVVNDIIHIEETTKDTYITDFCLYEMNSSLDKLIELVLIHKNSFNLHKCYVMDKSYYKGIECQFMESLGMNIKVLLNGFIKFQRFRLNKCRDTKVSKNANKSIPTGIVIILKRPIHDLPTKADLFLL